MQENENKLYENGPEQELPGISPQRCAVSWQRT